MDYYYPTVMPPPTPPPLQKSLGMLPESFVFNFLSHPLWHLLASF